MAGQATGEIQHKGWEASQQPGSMDRSVPVSSAPTAELSSASSSQNTLVKMLHGELCNPHKDAEEAVNLNRQF